MLKRRRIDILFGLAYIIFMAILIAILTTPSSEANGDTKMQVHSFNVDDIVDEVAGAMLEVQYDLDQIELPQYESLGIFNVTAYCPCRSCSGRYGNMTSTGVIAKEGVTIAVDPNVIPYGTKVYIDGKEYIAQDCGSAIKGNDIDLYFESHEVADKWGVQEKEVYVKKEE